MLLYGNRIKCCYAAKSLALNVATDPRSLNAAKDPGSLHAAKINKLSPHPTNDILSLTENVCAISYILSLSDNMRAISYNILSLSENMRTISYDLL